MRPMALCALILSVLIFAGSPTSHAQRDSSMHGMVVFVERTGMPHLFSGNVLITRREIAFTIYDWSVNAGIPAGIQDVEAVYGAAPIGWGNPFFRVRLIRAGIVVSIIPSGETWREECRKRNGSAETAARKVSIVAQRDSLLIRLERVQAR